MKTERSQRQEGIVSWEEAGGLAMDTKRYPGGKG